MSTSLPERPDLDQLRRQAKELRDAVRNCDTGAAERFVRIVGDPKNHSTRELLAEIFRRAQGD